MSEINLEKSTPPTAEKIEVSSRFNKVTPVSKFLSMFIFILLPFLGFALGVRYESLNQECVLDKSPSNFVSEPGLVSSVDEGDAINLENQNLEVKPEAETLIKEESQTPEQVIQNLRDEYKNFMTAPKPGNFYWPDESRNGDLISIEGIEVKIEETLVMPIEDGVNMAFILDGHITSFFKENGFKQKIFHLKDIPTIVDHSILGFENDATLVVCARIISDASKPELGYKVACGYKSL